MSSSLLHPPGHLPPAVALKHSQLAPTILDNTTGAVSASTLESLLSGPETAELWTTYENLLLACLRTGDDEAAHQCLGRLVKRFGDDNERILALKGLLKEADADDNATLDVILNEYQEILANNPTNLPVAKRRIALLRSMGKVSEAVSGLTSLLDCSPTDAESWSELADLYFSQGLYSQAVYALEEVLILQPNAWNIHARLGEIQLMAAKTSATNEPTKQAAEALKRFCRSIELCDDYLRGYYGLKLTTRHLLGDTQKPSKQADVDGWAPPEPSMLKELDAVATEKLAEIVRRSSAGDRGWQGYDQAEVEAARDLLKEEPGSNPK